MSKVVAYFEFAEMTQQNYDDVLQELKAQGKQFDQRRPSHVAFQKGPNWCVVDVWNSQDDLLDFAQNTLFPIFKQLGLEPPPPQVFPLHNMMGVKAEETISA